MASQLAEKAVANRYQELKYITRFRASEIHGRMEAKIALPAVCICCREEQSFMYQHEIVNSKPFGHQNKRFLGVMWGVTTIM